jgi:hypothetical protein
MIKGRNRAASGHQQVHTKAGRYNYTKIVEMAAETCYADYGYLVLHLNSSHGKFEVIATHNMGGIDLKLITQGPLLSATVKDTSLAIQHAYEDDRLKKNKIMHLTSELHVSVTGTPHPNDPQAQTSTWSHPQTLRYTTTTSSVSVNTHHSSSWINPTWLYALMR